MSNKELLKPTNDYVFRKIFGTVGNEDITRDLLEKILNVRYEKIDLSKNTIILPEAIDGKSSILDVFIQAEERENINIEMQVVKYDYMIERVLEYWAKIYSEEFKKGEDYYVAKRTICILITCFDMEQVKSIPNVHTRWNLREEEYHDVILTDKIEFRIINLKKLENENSDLIDKELLNWCKFISSPETLEDNIMKENKNIEKAKEVLCSLSEDEQEREIAYRRERAIRDMNTLKATGYNEGKKDGIKEGIEQGILEVAKNMLKNNMDVKLISKLTGLTDEEIKKIKV